MFRFGCQFSVPALKRFLVEWSSPIAVAAYPGLAWYVRSISIGESMSTYGAYEYFKGRLSEDKLVFVHSSLNEKMNFETLSSGIVAGFFAATLILVISIPIMKRENYEREEERFERLLPMRRFSMPTTLWQRSGL